MVDRDIIKEWIVKADEEAQKAYLSAKNIRNFIKKKLQLSNPHSKIQNLKSEI